MKRRERLYMEEKKWRIKMHRYITMNDAELLAAISKIKNRLHGRQRNILHL